MSISIFADHRPGRRLKKVTYFITATYPRSWGGRSYLAVFHHSEFGEHDELPHRYVLDRVTARTGRGDKIARFRELFVKIRPDVLAVRDNLLTPQDRSQGIFAFAAEHDCGGPMNKPLAQGLLTGRYDPTTPRRFGEGDQRFPQALVRPTRARDH